MLNTLSTIIGKSKSKAMPSQPGNPNFVTEQERIIKLIETIEASAQLCTVTFNGSKKIFSTSLLEFQPEQGYLILDEISPIEGNSVLQIVKALKLSAFVNGIHLSFKLDIIEHGLKQGIPYYKAALPKRIYYPQRRKAPRFFIDTHEVNFKAQPKKTKMPISGEVIDLSRGGLSINFIDLPVNFERGDVMENCLIILPDEFSVTFDLAVRSTKTLREHKIQIGGYFLNMPPKSKRKLEYYVAFLERETIRKQKN